MPNALPVATSITAGDGASSPIIIADAIPQGQLNKVADKDIVRQKMRNRLAAHARGIFELDPAVTKADQLTTLLRPYPAGEMTARPVSRLVNNPRHDGEELLAPPINSQ